MDIFCPANQAEEVYIRSTRRFIRIFFPSDVVHQRAKRLCSRALTSHELEEKKKERQKSATSPRTRQREWALLRRKDKSVNEEKEREREMMKLCVSKHERKELIHNEAASRNSWPNHDLLKWLFPLRFATSTVSTQ